MTRKLSLFLTGTLLSSGLMFAMPLMASEVPAETAALMELALHENVEPWLNDPALLGAIREQNAITVALADADVTKMDEAWKAEADAGTGPTIDPVLKNAISDMLRQKVEASGGQMTEVFIMDARGLNVAVSSPTSDYWQGDEPKFTETFAKGPDAIHMSDLEQDESTGAFQGQVSMTIIDPATGEAIGAVTAGFNADALM
jgi:hypothetical protein